jgi:predicted MFS family arabinose efflux permease
VAGMAAFVRLEGSHTRRLLPHGACNPATRLGATYATMLCLVMGITTEIFVPYFLQRLHGMVPLHAGYVSALMAGGWTMGSMISSMLAGRWVGIGMTAGPVTQAVGLAALCVLMPHDWGTGPLQIVWIGAGLVALGLGIGLCWPQLGARVFAFAAESERDIAAGSITIVLMVANAFGSALGGMVTNLAGLTDPGGVAGAASAALWLFGSALVVPALALLAVRHIVAASRQVATPA